MEGWDVGLFGCGLVGVPYLVNSEVFLFLIMIMTL